MGYTRHKIESANDIKNFIFSGHAIFTLKSKATGNHVTYLIAPPKKQKHVEDSPFFVSVFTGGDNTSKNSYSFVGTIFDKNKYVHSKKAIFSQTDSKVRGIEWFLFNLVRKSDKLNDVEFYHEGMCGHCGRRLTNPDSIQSGYGPHCVVEVERKNKSKFVKQLQQELDFKIVYR